MTIMAATPFLLLLLPSVLQLTAANHCRYNLTKPDQVIDVHKSKGLQQFEDIAKLHVDGDTVDARIEACADICCHAGDGCNVISLVKNMKVGDNCHMYKCDPPEECKWMVEKGSQSALLYTPVTTTAPPAVTTPAGATDSVTDTDSKTTGSNSDSTTTGPDTDSDSTTTGLDIDRDRTTTGSDTDSDSTTTGSDTDSDNMTTGSDSDSDSMTTGPDTDSDSTTTAGASIGSETTTAANSDDTPTTTAPGSEVTTEAPVSTKKKSKKKQKDKKDMSSGNATDTMTTPGTTLDDTSKEHNKITKEMKKPTTTTSSESDETTAKSTLPPVTSPADMPTTESLSTTNINTSNNPSLAPTISASGTREYDFDANNTQKPAPLRAKTADMSTTTVTTLACALAAGAMFVGVVATLIGKRFYDNWHRRHYQQIDYLVDGMYGS